MKSIKFRGAEVPIEITYRNAMFDFPKLGLNILKIFEDQETIGRILADDKTMIDIWYFYVKGHASTLEDAVDDLTPSLMTEFRDKFLDAVVNFINPQMRPLLMELLKEVKKELASPGEKLKKALSESLEEQG